METKPLNAQEYRSIAILSGIFSLRMLGLFMILPVFALYAKQLLDVTPLRVGLALGIYGLTQAIFQIGFGFLSDRFGRQPLVILGLMIFCLGSVVAALSDSIMGVIVGRSLQGAGAIGSVVMAWLTDLTRSEIRLRAMAILGITIGFSFGLSFLLGPLFTAYWGVRSIFWFTAGMAVLAVGVTFWVRPGTARAVVSEGVTDAPTVRAFWESLVQLCAQRGLFKMYFGIFILHASLTALFLKIPEMLANLQIANDHSWQFYLPVFLCSVLCTVPFILYTEKTKQYRKIFMFSGGLLAVAELCLLLGNGSLMGLALGLMLFFTAFNNLEASLPAYISEAAGPDQKGLALGVFSTLQFLGLFMGGVFGGMLDALGGHIAVLGFCVILALAWISMVFNNHS